ncbi:MAG: TetR/AcrR family transcriptional regulator [Pseudomonadota bacterium]
MNEREIRIADAAIRTYSTRGVRRTTMSDIAREADVTRQTVYNSFANTDEVLRAAIRLYVDRQWQKIRMAWDTRDSLDGKLDAVLQHFAIDPWDYVHSSEEAAELVGGYNEAGRAEIEAARRGFRNEIADLFVPFEEALIAQGTTPHAVADFISAAIEGIKYNYHDRDAMRLAVSTLKAAVLAMTIARDKTRSG